MSKAQSADSSLSPRYADGQQGGPGDSEKKTDVERQLHNQRGRRAGAGNGQVGKDRSCKRNRLHRV
jgi:hypothetical protein